MVLHPEDCFETVEECRAEIRRLYSVNDNIRDDARAFRFLVGFTEGMKWADFLPSLRPEDEKYVTPDNLRASLKEAIRAQIEARNP
jgi:hypothetical protein